MVIKILHAIYILIKQLAIPEKGEFSEKFKKSAELLFLLKG